MDDFAQFKRHQNGKALKQFLMTQMKEKEDFKNSRKMDELIKDKQFEEKFKTLDLVTVFPKISETPKNLQNVQQ